MYDKMREDLIIIIPCWVVILVTFFVLRSYFKRIESATKEKLKDKTQPQKESKI